MKSQSSDVGDFQPLNGNANPSLLSLHKRLHSYFSGTSSRSEQRLAWFGGLYLASLLSFSGLISAVRWALGHL